MSKNSEISKLVNVLENAGERDIPPALMLAAAAAAIVETIKNSARAAAEQSGEKK